MLPLRISLHSVRTSSHDKLKEVELCLDEISCRKEIYGLLFRNVYDTSEILSHDLNYTDQIRKFHTSMQKRTK